ncbi:MAG: ABC transporter permease, partial [Planctomycetota bacterium]
LVAYGRAPSIIVTLGMLTALRGVTELLMGGEWITDLPAGLRMLGTGALLGVPIAIWVAAAVAVGAMLLARCTALGLRIYAAGSNAHAARLAGLSRRRIVVFVFGLSGLLAAVATLVEAPQLAVIEQGFGAGRELLVVTCVVVGGAAIRGGVGTIPGTLLGVLLLSMVRTVLVFLPAALSDTSWPGRVLGAPEMLTYWERAIQGAFILAAVLIDHLAQRGRAFESAAGSPMTRPLLGFAYWHEIGLALLVVPLLMLAGRLDPAFLRGATQVELLSHSYELALVALPMTLIVITAGIDLSVGATMALASVVLGLAYEAGAPLWAAGLLAVATGAAAGALNGAFVAWIRVHPLIVTLATYAAYRGIAEGISLGRPISGFPESLGRLADGTVSIPGVGDVPVPAVILFVAVIVAMLVLGRTTLGRALYAIGSNETCCRYSGIAVDRIKLGLYTVSGLAAGFAAVLFAARRNTAKADVGAGLELDVITAVVLGGTSVFGGRGTIVGTLLGVLLIHETREFVSWHWQREELIAIVIGALLIASVLFGAVLSRRRE